MKKTSQYTVVLLISLACHFFACFQYWHKQKELNLPAFWFNQFFFLVALSLLLSISLFFIRNKQLICVVLFYRLVIFIIVGYPEGDYLGIEYTLITALIAETIIHLRIPFNIIFSVIVIAVGIFFQHPTDVWDIKIPAPSKIDLICFGFYPSILIIAASFLKFYFERMEENKESVNKLNNTVLQLTKVNIQFQEYAHVVGEESMVKERKRITRDIHDTIGYTMMNLKMMMDAAIAMSSENSAELRELLEQAKGQAKGGLSETRRALRSLRAIESKRATGISAIQKLVNTFENATGVKVQVEFSNMPWSTGIETDYILYHMVQEGMTNALRHGKATLIRILFWKEDSGIRISIQDNGEGSTEIKKGIGLIGMSERIEQRGGILNAYNIDGGFELSAWVPWNQETQ